MSTPALRRNRSPMGARVGVAGPAWWRAGHPNRRGVGGVQLVEDPRVTAAEGPVTVAAAGRPTFEGGGGGDGVGPGVALVGVVEARGARGLCAGNGGVGEADRTAVPRARAEVGVH